MTTSPSQAPSWAHSDTWRLRGSNFLVEVYHWTDASLLPGDGTHHWNVYAYIYPAHPRFQRFNTSGVSGMCQPATEDLPLHGGVSYLEFPQFNGIITCAKVGCDYGHLHDDAFTHFATREEALQVFADAEHLFKVLEAEAANSEQVAVGRGGGKVSYGWLPGGAE